MYIISLCLGRDLTAQYMMKNSGVTNIFTTFRHESIRVYSRKTYNESILQFYLIVIIMQLCRMIHYHTNNIFFVCFVDQDDLHGTISFCIWKK